MIKVKTICLNGHSNEWHLQPTVNRMAIGNLLIPSSIPFTGNTFQHVADFAKYLYLYFWVLLTITPYKTAIYLLLSITLGKLSKENFFNSCNNFPA